MSSTNRAAPATVDAHGADVIPLVDRACRAGEADQEQLPGLVGGEGEAAALVATAVAEAARRGDRGLLLGRGLRLGRSLRLAGMPPSPRRPEAGALLSTISEGVGAKALPALLPARPSLCHAPSSVLFATSPPPGTCRSRL